MPNTYTRLVAHIVFSTKDRHPVLVPSCQDELYAYLGGIIRNLGGKAITINGMPDHLHVLTHFPARISLSNLVRDLKSNSSSWLTKSKLAKLFSGWQTGYAAFTVDSSAVDRVRTYVLSQKEHHRQRSFKDEVIEMLQDAGIEYDERYLWD